jgi:hypothetical protein
MSRAWQSFRTLIWRLEGVPNGTVLRDCSGDCDPPLLYLYIPACLPKLFKYRCKLVCIVGSLRYEVGGGEPCRQSFDAPTVWQLKCRMDDRFVPDRATIDVPFGDRSVLGRVAIKKPIG